MFSRSFSLLLVLALALGAAITWIDTRPTWDDTGVTAALVFAATALLGLAGPSRAWVFALAVGAWIPAFGLVKGNHATLLALVFAFAGAYSGVLARRLMGTMAK